MFITAYRKWASITTAFRQLPGCWRFAAGLLTGMLLAVVLAFWPMPELLALLLVLAVQLLCRRCWLLAGLAIGYLWLLVFLAWRLDALPAEDLLYQPVLLQGEVQQSRQRPDAPGWLLLQVSDCRDAQGRSCDLKPSTSSLIRLGWYADTPLPRAGEQWQLEVRLRSLRSLKNFSVMPITGHLLAAGRIASGYVPPEARVQQLAAASGLPAWKQVWVERLQQQGWSQRGTHFYLVLLLGEGYLLTSADWQLLERTGTLHLWIISGLHLTLLAGLVLAVARCLRCPRLPSLVLALLLACGYAWLAGWGVAAQRSAAMLILGFLFLAGWRRLGVWTVFSLALILVLLGNPLFILTRGFWLSFMAVALLLFALRGAGHVCWWRDLLRVQWVITLGLTPLLLLLGVWFNPWSPLINLLVVPLVSFVLLPLGFITLGLYLGGIASWPAAWLVQVFDWTLLALDWSASWPVFAVQHPGYLWLGLLALLPAGFPARWLGWLGLLLAFLPAWSQPTSDTWQVQVLDVGQGTAVLLESHNQWLLYDTGNHYASGWTPVLQPLRARLPESGLQQLMLSHEDRDHAGGLLPILQRWPVAQVWLSGQLPDQVESQDDWPQLQPCVAGQQGRLGQLDWLVLWPPQPAAGRAGNADSCVLLVRSAEYSLLLTGDAGLAQEAFFAQALPVLLQGKALTLLVTGHHGSATATGEFLLQQARPEWAIHTSGWRNPHQHPHASVVQRLWQHRVRQLDTGQDGAIQIHLQAGRPVQPLAWRREHSSLWLQYRPPPRRMQPF